MANRINYSLTISQANSIKGLSDDLADEITRLENLLTRIKSDWKGPASDAFQKRLQMIIDNMRATKKDMSNVSSSIKTAADRIRQEDNRANSISGGGGGGGGGGSF